MRQRHGRNDRVMNVRHQDDLTVRRRSSVISGRQVMQRAVVAAEVLRCSVRQVAVDTVVGRRLRDVHGAESVLQVTATANLLRHRHQRCKRQQSYILAARTVLAKLIVIHLATKLSLHDSRISLFLTQKYT